MGTIRREFFYFFRTFTFTGILSVLPQLFLLSRLPADRALLLPVFLLLYSISGSAGLLASRRFRLRHPGWLPSPRGLRRLLCFGVSLLTNGILFSLFLIHAWPVFLGCLVTLAFVMEAAFNWFDHELAMRMSSEILARHSRRAATAQLIGIATAPLYFSLVYSNPAATYLTPIVTVGFIVLGYAGLSSVLASPGLSEAGHEPAQRRGANRTAAVDRLFLLFVVGVYCAAFLFASYALLLLRDLYRIPSPRVAGGLMIAAMNLSSVVGAISYRALIKPKSGTRSELRGGALALGGLVAAIILFVLRVNLHLSFVFPLACLAGLSYGVILLEGREYASSRTATTGNSVLTLYNMSADAASVAAFLVTLAATLVLGGEFASGYITAVVATIIAFLLAAFAALVAFRLVAVRSVGSRLGGSVE